MSCLFNCFNPFRINRQNRQNNNNQESIDFDASQINLNWDLNLDLNSNLIENYQASNLIENYYVVNLEPFTFDQPSFQHTPLTLTLPGFQINHQTENQNLTSLNPVLQQILDIIDQYPPQNITEETRIIESEKLLNDTRYTFDQNGKWLYKFSSKTINQADRYNAFNKKGQFVVEAKLGTFEELRTKFNALQKTFEEKRLPETTQTNIFSFISPEPKEIENQSLMR